MTERERLIEVLRLEQSNDTEVIADYLLENNIIVPPCKIGDTVYYVHRGRIERLEIHNITYSFKYNEFYVYLENNSRSTLNINYHQFIGHRLFNTLEEAEQALKARGKE